MKSILIIGGTGFIGSHVIKRSLELGYKTSCISLTRKLVESKDVSYYKLDVTNKNDLKTFFVGKYFDYIVNLSGYIDHSNFLNKGFDIYYSHTSSLLNVITNTIKCQPKAFVHIGSSDEYGNSASPQKECMRENPISPYSLAKVTCSHLAQMLYREHKYPITVLRPFLVFGPKQSTDRLIPYVINSCLNNQRFQISDGSQERDFIYISDFVDSIFIALLEPKCFGEILNVGSGTGRTIKSVVELIRSKIKGGEAVYGAYKSKKIENKSLIANLEKNKSLLKWEPVQTFENGIKLTIESYKE